VTDSAILSLDWALRGGTAALLLLTAGALWRDHGRLVPARLGALFALGSAAYAVCSSVGLQGQPHVWAFPLLALSAGNNVVFWLLASALFDDGFRLRSWHAAVWLALVVLGLAECLVGGARVLGIGLTLSSLAFAGVAIAKTVSSWRADLVEGRRRLRLFIVGASSLYIAATALSQLLTGPRPAPDPNLIGAAALLAIAGTVAWTLLRVNREQSLFLPSTVPVEPAAVASPPPVPPSEPVDAALLASLDRLMTVERAYRQDGLTIGILAQKLDLPEYRLRRLINQALGHRNFNSFVNDYRIEDAKLALADPGQTAVPILTIAMDAGFSSLGPFNRAFKAKTGRTPSEHRRLNTGIGEPIPDSASPISNPARGNLAAQ
jgi:AraC-like DNA-binding protein